jgi:hypothetical protein
MSTYELRTGEGSASSGENLEDRVNKLHSKLKDLGPSMWFSGSGSGERIEIFVPGDSQALRPLHNLEHRRIENNDSIQEFPHLTWAVHDTRREETYFEDVSGRMGRRHEEYERDEHGAVHDCDVLTYEDPSEVANRVEELLDRVLEGEPVKVDLPVSTAFEVVPLQPAEDNPYMVNITL